MTLRSPSMVIVALLALGLLQAAPLAAQSQANRALATREELENLIASKSSAGKLSDSDRARIQNRLRDGDFQSGDRLVLLVRGDSALSDTFAVRPSLDIVLPDMPVLSVKGVLRSEVRDVILQHISQFVRQPQLEVEPLIRLGLLGTVQRPGYYNVRADVPLSEVVMIAGGMTPDADFAKTTAERGERTVYSKESIRKAMAAGMSLDQLGLQGGDEIVVGRRSGGLGAAVPIIGGLAAAALAIIGLSQAL